MLTKHTEREYVTNRRRAEIANDAQVRLFIRLHCDCGAGNGLTLYYPDRAARIGGVTGPPRSIQSASREAASIMHGTLRGHLKGVLAVNGVKTDAQTAVGARQGGVLTGSAYAKVPTVLIEMCVLDNRADAKLIGSAKGRNLVASAIAAAIEAYLEEVGDVDTEANG